MFKLRHIPTGLFFKPKKFRLPSNLSKDGKIYKTRPGLKYLDKSILIMNPAHKGGYDPYIPKTIEMKIIPLDWEVVEYSVVAIGSFPVK